MLQPAAAAAATLAAALAATLAAALAATLAAALTAAANSTITIIANEGAWNAPAMPQQLTPVPTRLEVWLCGQKCTQ